MSSTSTASTGESMHRSTTAGARTSGRGSSPRRIAGVIRWRRSSGCGRLHHQRTSGASGCLSSGVRVHNWWRSSPRSIRTGGSPSAMWGTFTPYTSSPIAIVSTAAGSGGGVHWSISTTCSVPRLGRTRPSARRNTERATLVTPSRGGAGGSGRAVCNIPSTATGSRPVVSKRRICSGSGGGSPASASPSATSSACSAA